MVNYEPRDPTVEDHQDDSYGGCVICHWYRPHTDEEFIKVPYPCAVARERDRASTYTPTVFRSAEKDVIDALIELDKYATWSALGRPEYAALREALDRLYKVRGK